jgi:copper chaperone CopZ
VDVAERLTLTLPHMYADHHVQRVREVLAGLDGVADVYASAMDMQVDVEYDPAKTSPEAVRSALGQAGYEEGQVQTSASDILADRSSWFRASLRMTGLSTTDKAQSGDFRKY